MTDDARKRVHNGRVLRGAGSIAKAFLVLRSLSTFGAGGAPLKDIAVACGLPKASVHRMLGALAAAHLVERVEGTRDYRLGTELFAYGATVAEIADLRRLARPSLERLVADAGGVGYLGIRSGTMRSASTGPTDPKRRRGWRST